MGLPHRHKLIKSARDKVVLRRYNNKKVAKSNI